MEGTSSTTTATTTPEPEKKKSPPTERQVFKLITDDDGKPVLGPNGGEVFEKIGEPTTGGTRRDVIGDAADYLKIEAGTFMAPSVKSAATETLGAETKKLRKWS